jgi:AraC-like DNA-binding protein
MYKTHLTAWGIGKNSRVEDARRVLAHKQANEKSGQRGIYTIRGRPVNISDLERSCRRARTRFNNDSDELPSDIRFINAEECPLPFLELGHLKDIRSILHFSAIYIDWGFDKQHWQSKSEDEKMVTGTLEQEHKTSRGREDFDEALRQFAADDCTLGGALLRKAFRRLEFLIRLFKKETLVWIVGHTMLIERHDFPQIKKVFATHLVNLAKQVLPANHPFHAVFAVLRTVESGHCEIIFEAMRQQTADLYRRRLGEDHYEVICADRRGWYGGTCPWDKIEANIQQAADKYGSHSQRGFHVLYSHCTCCYDAIFGLELAPRPIEDYQLERLQSLYERLIPRWDHILGVETFDYRTRLHSRGRLALGTIYLERGRYHDAKTMLLEGLACAQEQGHHLQYTMPFYQKLQKVFTCLGEPEHAEQYRAMYLQWRADTIAEDLEELGRTEEMPIHDYDAYGVPTNSKSPCRYIPQE